MQAKDVLAFWELFEKAGLEVCIDGGWAVDALLGRQTRPHNDLDIALPASKVPALRRLLSDMGFEEIPQPDSWEHNFVLRHPDGALLDVHSYELNPDGSNLSGVAYIAEQLSGRGLVLGTPVRCVPPEWLVKFHTGYELDDDDWHDVRLLCEAFDLPVPEEYATFQAREADG